MKKLLFFVNPQAGHGGIRSGLMEVLQTFSEADYEITVHPTRCAGDLTRVIGEKGSRYNMIAVVGGDGTLNEAVSGLMELPEAKRPPLGYIPAGTVNDVAHTLGLHRNPLRAARDLVQGVEFPVDVGSFGDRWFTYVAAFGLFTDVSYRTPQKDKRVLGRLAYLLDGAKSLADIHPVHVRMEVDGEIVEEDVLAGLVTSTTSVGGFRMRGAKGISLNDGIFEILLIRNIQSVTELPEVAAALLRSEFTAPGLVFRRGSRATFTFPTPTDWTVDGEYGGTMQSVTVENHRSAVRIVVPK